MKVAFLNPQASSFRKIMRDFDCTCESKGNYLYQPYDLLLMSGFVPRDWDFQLIDAIASKFSSLEVISALKDFSPDVIVCSTASINWKEDLGTLKNLREIFPNIKLFTFGDLFLDEFPRKEAFPYVDGIFSSPILFQFEELFSKNFTTFGHEAFYQEEHKPLKNLKAPRQISIPRPRHEAFYHPSYRWPFSRSRSYTTIMTAWGCPYSCSYCILNKFPNYWRDYKEIISEMEYVKKLGFKEIYFGDNSFGLPQKNIFKMLDEMIRHNFQFSWSTYFHPNQYTPALLMKMKLAGCHTIIIGVETQNFEELKIYGRHVRKDQFSRLLEHAESLGIEVCGDFILGLPHDNRQSIKELINYACELKLDFASFNVATPLAGSSLRDMAVKSKLINEEEQHFDSSGHNSMMSLTELSVEELKSMREFAVKSFYLRPRYLIKRLLKIRNFEHLMIQLEEGKELLRARKRN